MKNMTEMRQAGDQVLVALNNLKTQVEEFMAQHDKCYPPKRDACYALLSDLDTKMLTLIMLNKSDCGLFAFIGATIQHAEHCITTLLTGLEKQAQQDSEKLQ